MDLSQYPDVVVAGGLGPALQGRARGLSLDIGRVVVPDGPTAFCNAWLPVDRGWVSCSLGVGRRAFVVTAACASHAWATGATGDLTDVVTAVAAWRGGVTLRDLVTRFGFLEAEPLAQAYEDGNPAQAAWASTLDLATWGPVTPPMRLLEAVHADEVLGRLRPSTSSHRRAVTCWLDAYDPSAGKVRIAQEGAAFEVCASWDDERVHSAATLAEAVALGSALAAASPRLRI
ncbi:hypothetical protein [Dactylosporangium salmoneum]|uniref:Uncharacterized protein n=1 Tax=Dactylosporangium salmoneum TaxID=53361 RepID=A0ABN3FX07_9ACTN